MDGWVGGVCVLLWLIKGGILGDVRYIDVSGSSFVWSMEAFSALISTTRTSQRAVVTSRHVTYNIPSFPGTSLGRHHAFHIIP